MAGTRKQTNAADKAWGYEFGCDGLMNAETARKFTDKSDWQLNQLSEAGYIRSGKMPGSHHRSFCRKSITDFVKSLEG